jgi:hypothetical protein
MELPRLLSLEPHTWWWEVCDARDSFQQKGMDMDDSSGVLA